METCNQNDMQFVNVSPISSGDISIDAEVDTITIQALQVIEPPRVQIIIQCPRVDHILTITATDMYGSSTWTSHMYCGGTYSDVISNVSHTYLDGSVATHNTDTGVGTVITSE